MADGTLRWNRRRKNKNQSKADQVPCVFAGGVLQEIERLHGQWNSEALYPSLWAQENVQMTRGSSSPSASSLIEQGGI